MFVIVMGVSGSGKTTIGRSLAKRLGCPFYDGDDFHPPANVAKMASGIPLNDEDRAVWLTVLADIIRSGLVSGARGVIACSALKERYRNLLRLDHSNVKFVYLKGSYELILSRMQARAGHYMKPTMLQSQFATLEEPDNVLTIDISHSPEDILNTIMTHLSDSP